MQPIQDKDFDQLFKNAFADAEVTPSKDLWSNIENEITPKKKRIIPVYWLSAAAVLLVATIGILVYQQQDVAVSNGKKLAANTIEAAKPVVAAPVVKDSVPTVVEPFKYIKPVVQAQPKAVNVMAKTRVKKKIEPVMEKQPIITAPEMQKQERMIAQVESPKNDIKEKIDAVILSQPQTDIVTASNATTVKADEPINDNEQSNKGIRNMGDVINIIVNKVDKRKDKFIQFRTDDDDSSLSSINIGPFKFGKRKK
ncbi:hypothetical protein [Pedobacter zeae]|uniref:Uncharacterized protein n=1 Tax=Pedobacter zeae TaxID=1737356 RepID=A0A7W6KEQ2_9SPHI|nr:hypothetical protein [Pedobacter zeae]MBB4110463.1 hypothetical protein [Pedobacter zeae]GGH18038.1 hypothetical protein GCM10007422_41980 [Pedobacter zeae]